MVGLMRMAQRVAMKSGARTAARPPQICREPRHFPLSQLKGATPTSLAISLRFNWPSSGSCASRVNERTGPTPGTLQQIIALAPGRRGFQYLLQLIIAGLETSLEPGNMSL